MKIIKKISCVIISIIMILQGSSVFAFSKSEIIFSTTDVNGNLKTSVVNNHLKIENNEYNSKIEDNSELENILNLNGEESYTLKGNLLQWSAMSNDIFYQGTLSKILPISIDIKYYLGDKEIKVEDLEGKSGNVTIELKFTNNLKNEVTINGKKRTLYTPFVVAVGAIFSNDKISNMNISNGKSIDTGSKNMMLGIASPGLYESLKIDDFKDFDTIKINFDTKDFENVATMYVVATPKLVEDADFNMFDKIDELVDSVNLLQKNMNIIEESAQKIEDGADALLGGVNTLNAGVIELDNGAKSLANGANTISANLKTVVDSVDKLKNGSCDLDKGIDQIIVEIEKSQYMFTSDDAKNSMNTLEYLRQTNLNTATQIESAYNTYGLQNLSIDIIMSLPGYDNSTKANLINVKNNYESGLVNLLKGNATAILEVEQKLNLISNSLQDLKNALLTVKTGTNQLSGGLMQLNDGVSKLYLGSTSLASGANDLSNGTASLSSGTKSLVDGTKSLSDGTSKLANGISEFNKQGISTLPSYASKVKDYEAIAKKMIELSNNYKGFSCNNASITTFVYAIKK